MSKKISMTFAKTAILDLEAIRDYYQEQQVPEVGERFLQEIIALIESLLTHRGRIVPEFNQPLLRELIHPPFRIVYRRNNLKISIVRIWRSERLMKLP